MGSITEKRLGGGGKTTPPRLPKTVVKIVIVRGLIDVAIPHMSPFLGDSLPKNVF